MGSRGPEVNQLKDMLRKAGLNPGSGDLFSNQTRQAVRQFQAANGLKVDGLVGQQTWGAFAGEKHPPGTWMLKGGGASGVAPRANGATDAGDGFQRTGSAGSVQGYVGGRPQTINVASIGDGKVMRADAASAYNAMKQAAARDGINLSVASGFRSQAEQQHLYDKYRNGTGNLAARPGHSNHQGGLSVDIGGLGGYGSAGYNWLKNNAGRFGFANDVSGEPWHWTYQR